MKRIRLLLRNQIRPVVVFDGVALSQKHAEIADRIVERQENRRKAAEALESGDGRTAYTMFQRSVRVTHAMCVKWMAALSREGVEYLVAPYEADAQLAYLCARGIVDFAITEDSDVLVYGAPRVVFKLDSDGNGQEIQRRDFGDNAELSTRGWTNDMFVSMCVLSGCDYCESVPGVGIKTAYRIVAQHRKRKAILRHVMQHYRVSPEYEGDFTRAALIFQHQRVFDPVGKKLAFLNDIKARHRVDEMDLDFLGRDLPQDVLLGVVEGRLHPYSHEPTALEELLRAGAAAAEAEEGDKENSPAAAAVQPVPPLSDPPAAASAADGSGSAAALRPPESCGGFRLSRNFTSALVSDSVETIQRKRRRMGADLGGAAACESRDGAAASAAAVAAEAMPAGTEVEEAHFVLRGDSLFGGRAPPDASRERFWDRRLGD